MSAFGDNIDIPFQVPHDCFDPERAFAALGFAGGVPPDPAKIDEGLLLRGDEIVIAQKDAPRRGNRSREPR